MTSAVANTSGYRVKNQKISAQMGMLINNPIKMPNPAERSPSLSRKTPLRAERSGDRLHSIDSSDCEMSNRLMNGGGRFDIVNSKLLTMQESRTAVLGVEDWPVTELSFDLQAIRRS